MQQNHPFTLFSQPSEFKEWNVGTYVTNSSPQLNHAMQVLNHDNWFINFAKQSWSKSPTIIDIGCGDGKITALLAKKFPKFNFIGVDYSFSMIDHAKNTYIKSGYPNLSFVCHDVSDKQFPKVIAEKVDCVLSFSTIHWIKNQKQLYENIQAISNPSAKFCIMFYSKDNYLWKSIKKTATSDRWKKYFPNYETPYYGETVELQELFKKQGINPSYDVVSQQYPSDGRAQLKNYLLGITPIYVSLQKSLESEQMSREHITKIINYFLEDVVQNITKEKNSTFIENKENGLSIFYYQRVCFRSVLQCTKNDVVDSTHNDNRLIPSKL